ncbi:hypothetical protein [Stakelama saccharophila]|uniref:Uncharacterized protein n=1 Tax=Stakelama saccharophila TaxID=3075605 RepID=A0ABZ0BBQ3_9SPHN|nr:hypothetical protein [Stakelama sp. W311]WNO54632.1 hypothetical protein RPR59_05105 [Stakelama sp. W311]
MQHRIVSYVADALARDERSDADLDSLRAAARDKVDGGTCERVEVFDDTDTLVFRYPPESNPPSHPSR